MRYIRGAYGVPARRGARIRYTGETPAVLGTVVAARGQYLRVRLDCESPRPIVTLHPTWEVEFLTTETDAAHVAASVPSTPTP
jgi:hypothetical protein